MAPDDSDNAAQDILTYDSSPQPSALGNYTPPAWNVPDIGQPSIFGDAFNPKPWTLADSTIHAILSPDDIKRIDFDGADVPEPTSAPSQPSQPDASGFTGLMPWQPDASSDSPEPGVAAKQSVLSSSLAGGNSVDNDLMPSSSPDGAAAQAGEYTLPGLGKTYLDPQFADKVRALILKAQDQNIPLQFTSGYRDPARQAALKNDPNAITPADQSLHSAGLAVDVNWKALSPDDRSRLLSAAADAGLTWGGNYRRPDPVHFYSDPGTDRGKLIDNFSRSVAALRNQIPDR